MRLNTHLQLVLQSGMCGAMLTLPLHALPLPLPFTVLVLYILLRVKKQDTMCCTTCCFVKEIILIRAHDAVVKHSVNTVII